MSAEAWMTAIPVTALAPGEMTGVELGGIAVAVYNVDGNFYATSNVCTHAFTFLTDGWLEDRIIECPLHAGRFDITTGKGQGAPITCDLKTFETRVAGDVVEVKMV